ncbi:hypothetical protein WA158_003600 [Blastocystis sp. Blastoise]
MELISWGLYASAISFVVVMVWLIYMGAFHILKSETVEIDEQYVILKTFRGTYSNMQKASDILDTLLITNYGFSLYNSHTLVFYHEDPGSTSDNNLTWSMGVVVDKDIYEKQLNTDELQYIRLPKSRILRLSFKYINEGSYIIGAKKCFRKLCQIIQDKNIVLTIPPIESHDLQFDKDFIRYYVYLDRTQVDFQLNKCIQL